MEAKRIIRSIGKERVAAAIGVSVSAVSEAARTGMFAASWYLALKRLGADAGVDVPNRMFRFKGVQATADVAAAISESEVDAA